MASSPEARISVITHIGDNNLYKSTPNRFYKLYTFLYYGKTQKYKTYVQRHVIQRMRSFVGQQLTLPQTYEICRWRYYTLYSIQRVIMTVHLRLFSTLTVVYTTLQNERSYVSAQ